MCIFQNTNWQSKLLYYLYWCTLSSLMDSIANLKVKTMKGKWVGARSLTCNILGVGGMLEFQDGTRKIEKQVNYSEGLAQTK